jgi:hypothetical protein
MTPQVPVQTNYIEALYHQIEFKIADPHSVLKQYNVTQKDIVNLCGGIPLPNITNIQIAIAPSKYDDEGTAWYGYYFWANLGFQNVEINEYREWAAEMKRKEPTLSELMQTDEGRELWKNIGISWIGEFFLAEGHPCYKYLRLHLKRKGIEFDL